MKARLQLLPSWIAAASGLYFLFSLLPILGFCGARVSGYTFLGFACEFPPLDAGTLVLQLLLIFFGLSGLALLFGHRAGVRMGLVCGYLGLGIRLTHDAAITSSGEAILQLDTFARIYFIIALNRIRPRWEGVPPLSWREFTWRQFWHDLGYTPTSERRARALAAAGAEK